MATLPRYTRTAIALHWIIALLLLGQFAFGLMLERYPARHARTRLLRQPA